MKYPILYSFRRWPYAIRARLALSYIDFNFEHREIHLKNRPNELYAISPKGTVPVLHLNETTVLDESLDIILWSNDNYSNQNLLNINSKKQIQIIQENDSEFKYWLDRYKYFDRYPKHTKDYYLKKSSIFLKKIDQYLENSQYVFGNKIQIIDLAIFPFIRQFANVDFDLFNTNFANIIKWYEKIVNSKRFTSIMKKYEFWSNDNQPLINNLYQQH